MATGEHCLHNTDQSVGRFDQTLMQTAEDRINAESNLDDIK